MTKVEPFVFNGVSSRVIFGHGALARTGDEIRKLGHGRALVLSTPNQGLDEEALSKRLDPLSAGVFAEAVMHTPVEVTEKALAAFQASGADCVVSLGGGSLKDFVDEQVARRGYSTSSEYVRELIRMDRDREKLRKLLLEGARSASGPVADKAYFHGLRKRVRQAANG